MNNSLHVLRTSALLLAVSLFALASVPLNLSAQSASDDAAAKLTGTWRMTSVTPDGDDILWKLTIVPKEGVLTATVSGTDAEGPAVDFKVDGSKVHFKTTYNGEEYLIDLTLEAEKLNGKWSGGGNSGNTSGTKAVPTAHS